ncbi:MAG: preprotein translocase subunit SecG [Spirochaetota bacterium]
MGVFGIILLVIFIIISLLMILLVVIQDENSTGLGGIFGGAGDTTLGSGTGNILTKITYIIGGLFLVIALVLGYINRTPENETLLTKAQQTEQQQATEWWNQPADEAEPEDDNQ